MIFRRGKTLDQLSQADLDMNMESYYKKKYFELIQTHAVLIQKHNAIVEIINSKGGEDFLNGTIEPQFNAEEIQKLILLCHPDKHDGKRMAVELTQKLLEIKKGK